MNLSYFNKSTIKSRLIKHVADLWGYQQADMDGFDPLVDLLLGACAVEFERVGNQIQSTHSRTLERLAGLLLPESLTIPQPAHAILKAQCVEPQYTLTSLDQFTFEKEIINPAKPTELQKKTIHFSPASPLPLFNASIAFLAAGKQLFKQHSGLIREPIATIAHRQALPENQVWLGIKLFGHPENIPAFNFFFDWKNNPDKQYYLDLLPLSRWSLVEDLWPHRSGYPESTLSINTEVNQNLLQEWDIMPRLEQKVAQLYQHHFISLEPQELEVKEHQQNFPEVFNQYFDQDALKQLKDPLIWLKLELPRQIPANAIAEMECDINCFPAFNRQLIDNRRPYRMDENLSIIPLNTDDFFLTMHKVTADDGQDLQAVPFYNIHQLEGGTYTIRKNNVGRFDQRNAREILQYVLELLRDENAAFAATGGAIGSKDIEELGNNINKIELNLQKKSGNEDVTHFLMLKPGKIDQVYISYWCSSGTAANRIPVGSAFKTKSVDIKSGSVLSITTTSGGKDRPNEQEKIHTFRSSLLSRERIVTLQDLKAACFAELGNAIRAVEVKKGYANFSGNQHGISRVIEVYLTPREEESEAGEWNKICDDLSDLLSQRSSLMVPVKVNMAG